MMNKNTFYSLAISGIRPETDSAVCITFDVPKKLKDEFQFIQGQHLTLKKTIDGADQSCVCQELERRVAKSR